MMDIFKNKLVKMVEKPKKLNGEFVVRHHTRSVCRLIEKSKIV